MDKNGMIRTYEVMLKSRRLDEFFEQLERKGIRVPNFHNAIGQEALSVGAVMDLRAEDYLLYTHRGCGSLLAKGVSLHDLMIDFFWKDGGTNKGFGSFMHVCDPKIGIVGRNGVFGSQFTIATGLGIAIRNKRDDNVVVCLFGEAAGARGPLYEALNMCVLWKLPVIFVAENNGFSINSRTKDIFATGNMSDVWSGFGIPIMQFDGNDIVAVRNSVREAIERARSGEGPSVLEGYTYRIYPHIPGEQDMAYRSKEEIEEWSKKDPVKRVRELVLSEKMLTEEQDMALDEMIKNEIEEAFEIANKTPEPDIEELCSMVYL